MTTDDQRLRDLEQGMAALKERVDTSLTYLTRDIAGVTRSMDDLRNMARDMDERAQKRDRDIRELLQERLDAEVNKDKEGQRWRFQQWAQTIGLFLAAITIVLSTVLH